MDDRNRVAVPAKFVPRIREMVGLGDEDPVEVVLAPTLDGTLGIYPAAIFEELLDEWETSPAYDTKASLILERLNIFMEEATLDKQNRVRIPPAYSNAFGLVGEVMVRGAGRHLDVVPRAVWEKQLEEFRAGYREAADESRQMRRAPQHEEQTA